MADRAPPPNLRPGATRITRAVTSATGVRRNLFQSQLTRRPTPTETARPGGGGGGVNNTSMTTSSSAETLRLDVDVLSESSEIVIRDQNGEFEIEDPPTPPLDDPDDEVALDDAQENERTHCPPHARPFLTVLEENHVLMMTSMRTGERQKLAEAVRHHQINHTRMPVQPEGK